MSAHRIEETIERGMCIGCGGCAVASGGEIVMQLGPTRLYQADISNASEKAIRAGSRVCPFSDESSNEDDLDAPQPDSRMERDGFLGTYSNTFAGRINDDVEVMRSSSGGLTSWLLHKLVDSDEIDAVISVGQAHDASDELFAYAESSGPELAARRKSQYYATTMSEVLRVVRDGEPRRFALVGVPCYIRAARALCKEDPALADRLTYFVALVCGHLKTQAYAESLAWQVGVPPNELAAVDFRVKFPGRASSDYGFGALRNGATHMDVVPMSELKGGNWGHNAFQPEACNFCDDVVGETADVSLGDAWLGRFTDDSRGTNIVVSRNRRIDEIFETGAQSEAITVVPVTPNEAAESQAGGFRHRRDGLAIRLADDIAAGLSVPVKRVDPDPDRVDKRRAKLLRQRRRIARRSQELFAEATEANNLGLYLSGLHREVKKYQRLEAPAVRLKRGLRPLKRFIKRLLALVTRD